MRRSQLAEQHDDADLAQRFAPLSEQLTEKEATIVEELNSVGSPTDIGGYYLPDPEKLAASVRPARP